MLFIFCPLFDVSILCTLVSSFMHINIGSWFIISSLQLGTFTIVLLFFGQRIQGLCFCYLLNTKFTWNKFKCKILNNLNNSNFHDGGDFSHTNVIMHQYFGKKSEMQKMNTSNFINNLTCCMIIFCTCCWHLKPLSLSLVNTKNQPNEKKKKNHFPWSPLRMDFITFKTLVPYNI